MSVDSLQRGVREEGTHIGIAFRVLDTNQIDVLPLEYHQTGNRVFSFRFGTVEKLDEDEGINRSTP